MVALTALGLGLTGHRAASAQDDPAPDGVTRAVEAVPEGEPRYLGVMRRELEALGVDDLACEAADPQRGNCTYNVRGASSGRTFRVEMIYSDRTDTVYLYIARYLSASPEAADLGRLMQRLMELNWSLLGGKFEWNPTDGEVRLSMLLNTDSNFDRRAFRGIVRGLGQVADRYYGQLAELAAGD